MIVTPNLLLVIAAAVCFGLGVFDAVALRFKIDFIALGLLFWVLAELF